MKTTLKLIALLSCIILYSCQSNSKAEPLQKTITPTEVLRSELDTFYLGGKLVRVEKSNKSEFDRLTTIAVDTSEIKNLETDAAFVKRAGDTLTIKTKAKEIQLVTNNNDENASDDIAQYSYFGYIKSIDQFLVYATYYESYDYLLIDNSTGAITHIWGLPVISPDRRHFVTANKDLLAGFTSNGIQLYKNEGKPRLLGEHLLDKWGTDDVKWINNTTLAVKAGVSDTISENLEHTEYFRLKFKE